MAEICPRTEALSARLDEQLGARARAAIDEHLAQCPVCTARFAELGELRVALNGLPDPILDFDLAEVIRNRLANEVPRRRAARARRRWLELAPLGIGAAACLALGLGMGMAVTAGGGVAVARPLVVMSVFAPIAPGGLCLYSRACTMSRTSTGSSLQ